MRVRGVGGLNLQMHAATDFNVIGQCLRYSGNIFQPVLSPPCAGTPITLGKHGVHLLENRLTFPRDETGSHLYATRLVPTPKKALTFVPAISGGSVAHPRPAIFSPLSALQKRRRLKHQIGMPSTCMTKIR